MNGESNNALVGPLDADAAIKSRIFTIFHPKAYFQVEAENY